LQWIRYTKHKWNIKINTYETHTYVDISAKSNHLCLSKNGGKYHARDKLKSCILWIRSQKPWLTDGWFMFGLSLVCVWFLIDLCLGYVWHLFGICLTYVWQMWGNSLIHIVYKHITCKHVYLRKYLHMWFIKLTYIASFPEHKHIYGNKM
jgi:hypothetical protein